MLIHFEWEQDSAKSKMTELADKWGLVADENAPFSLVMTKEHLELRQRDEPKMKGIFVDFVHGTLAYRRHFGGGRKEAIAKAVGIKGDYIPDVVDATAGLGQDAFVLACLGCRVRMIERHSVVAALLDDGLQRAFQDAELATWLPQRLSLLHATSQQVLTDIQPAPDVVYLDPMYPHKDNERAQVKKNMRIFRVLVGADQDADELLIPACQLAKKRVVVKRPDYASSLAGRKADSVIKTQKHRFDIYSAY